LQLFKKLGLLQNSENICFHLYNSGRREERQEVKKEEREGGGIRIEEGRQGEKKGNPFS
jgi:hypothetical protein